MVAHEELLHAIPLFHPLTDDELELLATALRIQRLPKGAIVFQEGDPAHYLLVVATGRVKVVLMGREGQELILDRLGPGSILGELAVLDGAPRSATAITLEPTVFLELSRERLFDLIERHPRFSAKILSHLAKTTREATERLRTMTMFDVYGRILRTVIALARRQGALNGSHAILQHRPSVQELANMVSCSRETVSRAMKVLQENGYLSITGKDLTIEARALKQYWYSV